jgi:hypothetical protein
VGPLVLIRFFEESAMPFVLKSAAGVGVLALMLALAPLAQAHEAWRRDPCPPRPVVVCPPPCPVVVTPPCPVVVSPGPCYVAPPRVEHCRVVRYLPRHRERCR